MKTILVLALSTLFVGAFAEKPMSKSDEAFLREANIMLLKSQGKEPCDMTTSTKMVVKGEAGCCSAPGAAKTYKFLVKGKGYRLFSCPDEAAATRKALIAKGVKCGPVQKIAK